MRFSEYPTHIQNPFVESVSIPSSKKAVAISPVRHVVGADGTLRDETARLVVSQKVDGGSFTKLFLFPYFLSGPGAKVFLYIVSKLPFNETCLSFDPAELYQYQDEDIKMSKKSVYRALVELIDAGIIAKAGKHRYHFNPVYGFKGNRLTLRKVK